MINWFTNEKLTTDDGQFTVLQVNRILNWPLLRAVSRSFYLTLRILPGRVRDQIGLAYLLARTSDTIADTQLVPVDARLAALLQFRKRVLGKANAALSWGQLEACQASPAERLLLENADQIATSIRQFETADQERIRDVLAVIIGGQELDLQRFGQAHSQHWVALPTDDDLEDYTYRVAGCVGEFWTRLCRAHLFPSHPIDDAQFLADAVRFGKGLQLVNIFRDLPVDLRAGRCYVPKDKLNMAGLEPNDLLNPSNHGQFRPLYEHYLDRAAGHLQAGWRYTNTVPFRCWRIRLACAWPILIGFRTLHKMRPANILDPGERVKISRKDVRNVVLRSIGCYAWPSRWRRLVP